MQTITSVRKSHPQPAESRENDRFRASVGPTSQIGLSGGEDGDDQRGGLFTQSAGWVPPRPFGAGPDTRNALRLEARPAMDAGARARELIYLASIASHSPLFTIDELDEEIRTADTLVESGETRSVRLGLVLGFASLLAAGEERGVRNAVERSREIAGHMRDAASAWVCDVHALLLDLGTVHQSRYEEAVQLLEDLPETGRDDDTFCALRDAAALRFAMAG